MPPKSFYDLEFSVGSGGARKDAHYIRGSLEEVKTDLAAELSEGLNLYLLCWYGARLSLHVYQQGRRTESIDLHPFVTIVAEGCPVITFEGPAKPLGWDFSSEEEEDDDSLSSRFFLGELDDVTTVTVGWAAVDVPPLTGEVAAEGDVMTVDDRAELPYGWTDREI